MFTDYDKGRFLPLKNMKVCQKNEQIKGLSVSVVTALDEDCLQRVKLKFRKNTATSVVKIKKKPDILYVSFIFMIDGFFLLYVLPTMKSSI